MTQPPGLRIESASSVVLRDTIKKHMELFAHVIKNDRVAGQAVVAAYIDGLAGAMALVVAGGHGGRTDVEDATLLKLRECFSRDLQMLARQ